MKVTLKLVVLVLLLVLMSLFGCHKERYTSSSLLLWCWINTPIHVKFRLKIITEVLFDNWCIVVLLIQTMKRKQSLWKSFIVYGRDMLFQFEEYIASGTTLLTQITVTSSTTSTILQTSLDCCYCTSFTFSLSTTTYSFMSREQRDFYAQLFWRTSRSDLGKYFNISSSLLVIYSTPLGLTILGHTTI